MEFDFLSQKIEKIASRHIVIIIKVTKDEVTK